MRVVLVKPTYFRVDYSINPWMSPGVEIDKEALFEEYEDLKKIYKKLNVEIIEIDQEESLPDMVYTRDWGFVYKNKFILGKFKYKERKPEAKIAKKLFRELGFEIVEWTGRDYFEAGDLILRGDTFYFGYGKRSSHRTQKRIEEITNLEVINFKLSDNYFFHLDTCVMPLDNNTVVYYPKALSMLEQAKISFHFDNPIPVSEEDAKIFGCNMVKVGNTIILPKKVSNDLDTKIQAAGFDTVKVDLNEYLKGGGGIRCISLIFD